MKALSKCTRHECAHVLTCLQVFTGMEAIERALEESRDGYSSCYPLHQAQDCGSHLAVISRLVDLKETSYQWKTLIVRTVEMNSPIYQSNLRVNNAHHPQ